ncbi:Uncharacterized protein TPAR_00906 [Tolypocladium paradoxum]|uniref:Uncharacterized protein n=1 Tax=Tolypocladium paradoxum TaxID=94208 RepID=A0A2S4L915_9HYPO|nr:Uncharacterized protein TPAR_00906 [Tolypocladium paradoxum]
MPAPAGRSGPAHRTVLPGSRHPERVQQMTVRLPVLVRVALHAIPALFAESTIAFLAYSSIFGCVGTRVVGMYITAAWCLLLDTYLSIAFLVHDFEHVKLRRPRPVQLVCLYLFTIAITFVGLFAALHRDERTEATEALNGGKDAANAEGTMSWQLFAAIFLEAVIGLFHLLLALDTCLCYGRLQRESRRMAEVESRGLRCFSIRALRPTMPLQV